MNCQHRFMRWLHNRSLGAVIRTCTECGHETDIVAIDVWNER